MAETKLLQEIDSLHQKLLQEPTKSSNIGGPCCYVYCSNVKKLVDKILFLQNNLNVDYANVSTQNINNVLNKEIKHVHLNISNHNQQEVVNLMNRANNAINRLFYTIFQKIKDELKEENSVDM